MTAQKSVIPMNEHGRAITQEDIKPTVLPDAYLTSSIASALVDFKMPRFEDLPTVGLYRDQVIGIVEQTLSPLGTCIDGELLTPSMVNNYVKAGLIAAPVKKLYNREHVARLLFSSRYCRFKRLRRSLRFSGYPIWLTLPSIMWPWSWKTPCAPHSRSMRLPNRIQRRMLPGSRFSFEMQSRRLLLRPIC